MDTQNLNVKCDTNTDILLGLFRYIQPLQLQWGEGHWYLKNLALSDNIT